MGDAHLKSRRKICVVTGSRAEYGLLYWLMKEVLADEELRLQLLVTGMHLSPEFGLTFRSIEDDGFTIDGKVEMLLSSDTPVGIAKSMGLGVMGFADALSALEPDVLVVLGDRYEIFAAVQAAMVMRLPIAHIHGGEVTEGVIDEAIRHSITKMSHLHFVAAEPYGRRVIQLGEDPHRVYNVGAVALDNLRRESLIERDALEREIGIQLTEPFFLVTYHPVTLDSRGPARAAEALCAALESFPESTVIFTKANADTDGRVINRVFDEFAARHCERMRSVVSLGRVRYLSAMALADVVIGNSSSAIIEAPFLKKAAVNVGPRQSGRLKAESVIDCPDDRDAITYAIRKAISPEFKGRLPLVESLYGRGNASFRIKEVLKTVSLENLIVKAFHDADASQAAAPRDAQGSRAK